MTADYDRPVWVGSGLSQASAYGRLLPVTRGDNRPIAVTNAHAGPLGMTAFSLVKKCTAGPK